MTGDRSKYSGDVGSASAEEVQEPEKDREYANNWELTLNLFYKSDVAKWLKEVKNDFFDKTFWPKLMDLVYNAQRLASYINNFNQERSGGKTDPEISGAIVTLEVIKLHLRNFVHIFRCDKGWRWGTDFSGGNPDQHAELQNLLGRLITSDVFTDSSGHIFLTTEQSRKLHESRIAEIMPSDRGAPPISYIKRKKKKIAEIFPDLDFDVAAEMVRVFGACGFQTAAPYTQARLEKKISDFIDLLDSGEKAIALMKDRFKSVEFSSDNGGN